ncbi:MAG: HU family DNA-binding protein [Acidobacteriota bacterium]|nr:HU family DNA-binding protein [Acidobacteriota bacterium]
MIKKDIVEQLHEEHGGMTLPETEEHVNTLLELLKDAMDREDVTITHFGKFRHKHRKVREIILPSGKKQLTNATDRIQFLPSPALKTKINSES